MSKQFWGVILVIFLVFAGIFVASSQKSSDTKSSSSGTAALSNHTEGTSKLNINLTEYGDYECVYCGQYYPVVKEVQEKYKDQIVFQFRNFPLVNVHRNAFAGARAAEAAALQNKFWEMHNVLYVNQSSWSAANDPTTYFKQYAQQLGLNVSQFTTDYASSKVNDIINADTAEGTKLGIQGTPSFFLDGKKVEVTQSVESFDKVIKAAIAKKGGSTAANSATTPAATTDSASTDTGAAAQTTTGN